MEPKTLDDLAKVVDASAWPIVAVFVLVVILTKADAIAQTIKRAPLIQRIGFQGFEIQLDLNNINELQEKTDKTLLALIQKTDKEVQRIVRLSGLSQNLRNVGKVIFSNIPNADPTFRANGKLRCTLHIQDAVFTEYLYQSCNYYYPWTDRYQSERDRTSGRRFSVRYGIIGLAARTEKTQTVGNALSGTAEEVENLISHWSMTPAEAESARSKPSCIAMVLRNSENLKVIGILYADAEAKDFFGDQNSFPAFQNAIESSSEYKGLIKSISDVSTAISQIEIAIDLNRFEKIVERHDRI